MLNVKMLSGYYVESISSPGVCWCCFSCYCCVGVCIGTQTEISLLKEIKLFIEETEVKIERMRKKEIRNRLPIVRDAIGKHGGGADGC